MLDAIGARRSGADVAPVSRRLGTALEFSLCDVLEQLDGLRGYWCDGVRIERLEVRRGTVVVEGDAWLGRDRGQWLVPARARFAMGDGRLRSFRVDLGDRSVGTLAEHATCRGAGRPSDWLLSLQVEPERDV